jgi:hypothetical protein
VRSGNSGTTLTPDPVISEAQTIAFLDRIERDDDS